MFILAFAHGQYRDISTCAQLSRWGLLRKRKVAFPKRRVTPRQATPVMINVIEAAALPLVAAGRPKSM
jgi:hypothetical protein